MNNKILVSAYGCEPDKGSEPGIGWQWTLQIARMAEVWIITRENNQDAISEALTHLESKVSSNLHFIYYDTVDAIRKIKKGDKRLYIYYLFWQIGAYKKAKKLASDIKFDYCIALTFGSIWMPTFMYKINAKFIWGPIGGGEAVPDEYLSLMGTKNGLVQKVRKLMAKCASINPFVRQPIKKAWRIIARTEDTFHLIPKQYKDKTLVCLETAIELTDLEPISYSTRVANKKVKIIFSGRLIKIKGLTLLLNAAAALPNNLEYEILFIGDGGQKKELAILAEKLGILEKVHFVGKVARNELLELLHTCDIYAFPSLKEGGSWSLMEAMACGLPVICLDTSGMHLITDDSCAIRIPVQSTDETVKAFTRALDSLIHDSEKRIRMGIAARKRIEEEFQWDKKGDFLRNLLMPDK